MIVNGAWKLSIACILVLLSVTALVSSFDYSGRLLSDNAAVASTGTTVNVTGARLVGNGESAGGIRHVDGSAGVVVSSPAGIKGNNAGDSFDTSLMGIIAGMIELVAAGLSNEFPSVSAPLYGIASWLAPPPETPPVASPSAQAIPSPVTGTVPGLAGSPVVAILLIFSIIVIAVLAFVVVKKYGLPGMKKPGTGAPVPAASPAGERNYHEGAFRLRFPDIGEPFPLLWGAGEPLVIKISSNDDGRGKVSLAIDGAVQGALALEGGDAAAELVLKKGTHRITVEGLPGQDASWAEIRIVDYREEIVGLFHSMSRHFMAGGEGVTDEMTPRELGRAVVAGMPEVKRTMLDDAVSVFEVANYSVHPIDRREYEKMYRSKMGMS